MRAVTRHFVPLAMVCVALTLSAGDARADIYTDLALVIDGSQEVPPVATGATGVGYVRIDTNANTLEYHFEFSGLSSGQTAAHIHGFAAPGVPAGVLEPIPNGSPSTGTWNYDEGQEANILAGLTYVNIHTTNNTGGEIRGQIVPLAAPGHTPWGLIAVAVLMLGAATVFFVRRRVAA